MTDKPSLSGPGNETATTEVAEIIVDGRRVRAVNGQNLVDALLDAGEEVSSFCYHTGLSVAAQCRQCLVGLGDAFRLVPACQLTVQPGMVIRSNDEQVLAARRAMLEYTLLNHPVDCVICDKAGECTLQRHYMDWDGAPAQINHEKVRKPKKIDIGPDVMLDAERCILCSRCIRFCEEVAGNPQLVFAQRGDHTVLSTAPGERLDNPYALNTVDICPVGALTDKDFRFQSRVWDLWATRSVCNGCATGCRVEIHHKGNQIYRMVPPKRWDMNLNWMCDHGRRTYKAVAGGRLTAPTVEGSQAEMRTAIGSVAHALSSLAAKRTAAIAVVLGADTTNEDSYAAAELARELPAARLFYADRPNDGHGDGILRRSDPNPNRIGVRQIASAGQQDPAGKEVLIEDLRAGRLEALYLVGSALELPDDLGPSLDRLELVVMQATHPSALSRRARVVLPAAAWAEVDGTITNGDGAVQRLRAAVEPPGYARPHWALVDSVAAAMGRGRRYDSAKDVFEAMRQHVGFFSRAIWGEEIPTLRLRWAGRRG